MKLVAIRNVNVDNSVDLQRQLTAMGGQVYLDGFTGGQLAPRGATSPIQAAAGEDQLAVAVNITAAASR
jgi:hypothetical protein